MIGFVLKRALWSGAVGAVTSAAAFAAAARLEGRGGAQPLNATSHWLRGDRAARRPGMDPAHTGVGLATHVAATVFWAGFYELWTIDRPPKDSREVVGRVAALAAAVGYTITPRRFTSGWEHASCPSARWPSPTPP